MKPDTKPFSLDISWSKKTVLKLNHESQRNQMKYWLPSGVMVSKNYLLTWTASCVFNWIYLILCPVEQKILQEAVPVSDLINSLKGYATFCLYKTMYNMNNNLDRLLHVQEIVCVYASICCCFSFIFQIFIFKILSGCSFGPFHWNIIIKSTWKFIKLKIVA